MKKLYFLFLLFTSIFANAQDAFITKWEFSNSANLMIMPVIEDPENNYTIDFGDGTILTDMTGQAIHSYANPGTYIVTMTGVFKHIDCTPLNGSINYHFKSIEQWGTNQWGSMHRAFSMLPNMVINATDAPDLSQVTDMSYMFAGSSVFNQNINHWNVSNVENMAGLFVGAEAFNQPLDNWDVSSVNNMEELFSFAYSFNQPLEAWNISSVSSMKDMFRNATAFNQPLENWDISGISDITGMFAWATAFNQPLNNWNVSNITDMKELFFEATSFNQPLDSWDVSNVINMYSMFYVAESFNQNLSDWTFNEDIIFGMFVSNTNMSVTNYDLLLARFLELELESKDFTSNLHFCNSEIHYQLEYNHNWSIFDYYNEDCGYNTIYGKVQFDINNDGCDVADIPIDLFLVNADNGNPFYSATPLTGSYELNVIEQNTYTLSLLNVPSYFMVITENPEVTFLDYGAYQEANFCIKVNETINDLNVTLLPVEEARPGFETDYQLVVQNMGTQNVPTATVNLSFDDALQTFVSANPAPIATTTNELTFTITDLEPFQSRIIDLKTKLFEPPVVNGGEISNFTATITPNDNDFTPNDNTFNLAQTIVNSFDPNDKRVLQGEEIFVSQTDDYLDYIIRFQNTGTASAITVKVKDVLSENLDWNTFQMISASHNYRVSIKEGNQVEFVFDNINLPHETANEPGSHGFIAYKIKPVANLQVGDVINGNTSSIYFDYNLPIITNSTTTTVVKDIEPIEISATITNVSCNGINDGAATVSVTGGSGTYSYAWSPSGGSEATATGLAAGDYIVTVNDGFESEILSITITEPEAITISTQPEDVILVQGGNTVFSVVALNVEEYQWQVSSNGTDWSDINNGGTSPTYAGVTTDTMNITGIPLSYDGYKYRVLLSNGDNCITYSDEANAEVNAVAGIDSYDNLGIKIYPNPSKSLVFVNVTDVTSYANLKISVLDINGRILLEEPISDNLKNIDLLNFQSGMYIFTISSDKFRFSKYIIKE